MTEEVIVTAEVIGEVIGDVGNMTMEQMHVYSMAPDFNENKVLQTIVAKWKEVHLPQA